jgi:hypothetical protein
VHIPEFQPSYSVPQELRDAFDLSAPRSRTARSGSAPRPAKAPERPSSPPPAPVRFRRPTALKPLQQATQSASASSHALDLDLDVGVRVVHDRFGIGKVTELTGEGSEKKATIVFDNAGEKKIAPQVC